MVEIPVQLQLELEGNLVVHNVIEREIERERVQMKPPPRHATNREELLLATLRQLFVQNP